MLAEELTLRFKASPDPAIRAAQQQLVEAWALASALYVDADAVAKPLWHQGISSALDASFSESDPDGVRRLQDDLLAKLGDPFTRVLRGAAAERLAAEEEGQVVSNGLALLPQEEQDQWAVAFVAPAGPAERAGVRVGDVVIAVDGAAAPPPSAATDKAAGEAFLAKATREPVELRLQRGEGQPPLVARLRPAPVDVQSVQWGVLRVGADGQKPVSYLRIAQFSQRTPSAVRQALGDLFGGKGESEAAAPQPPPLLLIDLRDDIGGVVEAGVEVARQLLRPGDALAEVTARSGESTSGETSTERVVLSSADAASSSSPSPLYSSSSSSSNQTTALNRPRIAVLTNHNTASTAELLAGALRDGGPQATLVGERTFGKGRTQRVMQLQNDKEAGATLLVSTMRFATPTGVPIDGVGLEPAVACASPPAGFEVFRGGGGNGEDEDAESQMRALLEGDACVRWAAELLATAAAAD